MAAITPPFTPSPPVDCDDDNDGLIDVRNLAQLDAIRHDLDCDGATYSGSGNSATDDSGDTYSGGGGNPIGNTANVAFAAAFKGNGFAVSNLFIKRTGEDDVGLFSAVGGSGRVESVGVRNACACAQDCAGIIAGCNFSANSGQPATTIAGCSTAAIRAMTTRGISERRANTQS